ncbi:MAG: electron transport complex subunit RsxC [Christensenellales bacterium]
MQYFFKGGVHPDGMKELTEGLAVNVMPAPDTLYVSLSQHIGKPAKAVVDAGREVKMGELIAQADGAISGNIYSPVSGTVKGIELRPTPSGKSEHIVIENDKKYTETRLEPLTDPTPEQIVNRIAAAGIVGLGGAGFPTGVKFKSVKPIDTLIINGAECEPYITCDARIMVDYAEQFIGGVRLLYRALNLSEAVIGVEDNKKPAVDSLTAYLDKNGISDVRVCVLKTKYPQGAEKQLIYAVTGRKVPMGALPASVGVVVANVHTALSAFYAVTEGVPLYKRIMTVTGGGIERPANLWVSNGTLYNDVIEFCGGIKKDVNVVKMINGGPMMGAAVSGGTIACTKTTSCLLLMTDKEAFTGKPSPCINCARCADVCPMRLMPMYMDLYSRAGDLDSAVKYGLSSCIECGCCTYICPAKRTLVQSFRLAKKQLRGRK